MKLPKGWNVELIYNKVLILSHNGRAVKTYRLPDEIIHKMAEDIIKFIEESNGSN